MSEKIFPSVYAPGKLQGRTYTEHECDDVEEWYPELHSGKY